jgi:hypothetical protein
MDDGALTLYDEIKEEPKSNFLSRTSIDRDPAAQWQLLRRLGLKPQQLEELIQELEAVRDQDILEAANRKEQPCRKRPAEEEEQEETPTKVPCLLEEDGIGGGQCVRPSVEPEWVESQ